MLNTLKFKSSVLFGTHTLLDESFRIYRESPVSLNFCILSLFYVNGPKALYVNPGCVKCISGINLSPVNKNLLTFHSLYTLY